MTVENYFNLLSKITAEFIFTDEFLSIKENRMTKSGFYLLVWSIYVYII